MPQNEGAAGANPGNTSAPAPAAAPKYYLATAESRAVNPESKAKDTLTFVVEGEDYKTAWANARELTRVGDAYFKGRAWTDNERKDAMKMAPGLFTVQSLSSLQQRSRKQEPVSLDRLVATLEERGVSVPANLRKVIDELREAGPTAANGEGVTQEAAAG